MMIGNFTVTISPGFRVAVPKRFRQELKNQMIAAKWYEGCVVLIPETYWQGLVGRVVGGSRSLTQAVRDTDRFLLGSAHEIVLDQQGRFVIPESLRVHAKLSNEVVFLGLGDRVEVWDKKEWEKKESQIAGNASDLVEGLNG